MTPELSRGTFAGGSSERSSTFGKLLAVALTIATFGPYVVGSVRTEQVAVYGTLVLLWPIVLLRFKPGRRLPFLAAWIAYIAVAVLGVVIPSTTVGKWLPGSPVAGLDNVLSPLAIMLLIFAFVPAVNAQAVFTIVIRIVAIGMAINGLIGVISTQVDTAPALRRFWSVASDDGSLTVAELAGQLGRFGGIFNQPSEAGALYAISGLAAIYAWRNRPVFLGVILTLIIAGGLISVSKIFVLAGLPLIVFYWLWTQQKGRKIGLLFGMGLIVIGVVQSGLVAQWSGFNFLARLFSPQEGGLVVLYSAGRFESDSSFSQVIDEVMKTNPVSGIGIGGWQVAYDGALAEALVFGGVIGVLMYVLVYVALLFNSRAIRDQHLRQFSYLFLIVLVASATGFSPLTGNRVSTVVWIMISLLVLCRENFENVEAFRRPLAHRNPLNLQSQSAH